MTSLKTVERHEMLSPQVTPLSAKRIIIITNYLRRDFLATFVHSASHVGGHTRGDLHVQSDAPCQRSRVLAYDSGLVDLTVAKDLEQSASRYIQHLTSTPSATEVLRDVRD